VGCDVLLHVLWWCWCVGLCFAVLVWVDVVCPSRVFPFHGSSLFVCMTPPLCDSSFHLSSPARLTALDRLALFIFLG